MIDSSAILPVMVRHQRRMAYQQVIPREYSNLPCPIRQSHQACARQFLELWLSSMPTNNGFNWNAFVDLSFLNSLDVHSWVGRRSSKLHLESYCPTTAGSWSYTRWSFLPGSLLSMIRWRKSSDSRPSRSWHEKCFSVPWSSRRQCLSQTSVTIP